MKLTAFVCENISSFAAKLRQAYHSLHIFTLISGWFRGIYSACLFVFYFCVKTVVPLLVCCFFSFWSFFLFVCFTVGHLEQRALSHIYQLAEPRLPPAQCELWLSTASELSSVSFHFESTCHHSLD